jgi:hypothetical protein
MRMYGALPPAERRLVIEALSLIAAVRLGLCLLPYPVFRRLLERVRPRRPGRTMPVERLVWSVEAAARRIPGASCLTRAFAGRLLLMRYGHPALVHVGVRKTEHGRVEAHAWVESGDAVVIGGSMRDGYTPLLAGKREL